MMVTVVMFFIVIGGGGDVFVVIGGGDDVFVVIGVAVVVDVGGIGVGRGLLLMSSMVTHVVD